MSALERNPLAVHMMSNMPNPEDSMLSDFIINHAHEMPSAGMDRAIKAMNVKDEERKSRLTATLTRFFRPVVNIINRKRSKA